MTKTQHIPEESAGFKFIWYQGPEMTAKSAMSRFSSEDMSSRMDISS